MKRALRLLSILGLSCAAILPASSQHVYKEQSVLATGTWFKIAIESPGLHVIDHAFVTSTMGLNAGSINARQVRVFGNRGGALPQRVGAERIDDLEELSAKRVGLDDGSFDPGDYILFYAEGPDRWYLNEDDRFNMVKNIYDTQNHYFIQIDGANAQAVEQVPSLVQGDLTVQTFDDYQRLEDDRINLLGKFQPPGSGKRWFGDEFSAVREKSYTLDFPNIVSGSEVLLTVEFAGRSGESSNVFVEAGGLNFSQFISRVNLGNVEDDYARIGRVTGTYLASGDQQEIVINYPAVGSTTSGWLDFIQLQTQRALTFTGPHMAFRNVESQYYDATEYIMDNVNGGVEIWDISNPLTPVAHALQQAGSSASFVAASAGAVREYLAFTPGTAYPKPVFVGPVKNQNLHAISEADLVVIYHPDFEEQALRLAEHRRNHNGYTVVTTPVQQVFNEFSGGSVDATAMRDFAAMLYNRDPDFRFMLFMGDGTYDMRHLNQDNENDNFIPVYETNESLDPIRSFPSDDYFALLNENEGSTLLGAIDIAVGRLPVGTAAEAEAVVNKIIDYDVNPEAMDDWRLRLAYVADDEDNNLHLNQSEEISDLVEVENQLLNLNRIYLDAFQQMSTPGGARYPEVNAAINNTMFKGALAVNYLGHGGHLGWSQERILGIADIQSWSNYTRLPVFVTATCSFTGYDEPTYQSAGEQVLLNPGGGAVALLTTVRAVYSSSNKRLTKEVFEHMFDKVDGEYLPIGEIMRIAKNSNAQDTVDINARKFAIIGDPSMFLALPQHDIVITEVNGTSVQSGVDTARALDRITLGGEVHDRDGNRLQNFSGVAKVTVFDKPVKVRTLANDPKSFEREFENLSRVIFKGSATVTNGAFEVSFVVPEDIDFTYGNGKVSVYATDGVSVDAGGSFGDLIIGGTSEDNAVDNEGPDIQIFMNTESFVDGGKTGPNPTLLLKLSDASGISVIGNSIGHDLVAVLDGNNPQSYVLNEFYEATIDDFTSGSVRFPLTNLALGQHFITVTAWDVAGNFSEATLNFEVVNEPGNVIRNVWNYPNPAHVSTRFEFTHDLPAGTLNAYIDIFDTWGRFITTIDAENVVSSNGVVRDVEWQLTGSEISGVYVYQVRLVANPNTSQRAEYKSAFQKLVLIN